MKNLECARVTAADRPPVAVVGAGLIGRAWAIVFARAGHPVRLHDMDAATMAGSHAYIADRLSELADFGLLDDAPEVVLARIRCEPNLADALRDVVMVQENVRETVEAKTAIFAQLDALAPPDAVLASSTSWLPASDLHARPARDARVAWWVTRPILRTWCRWSSCAPLLGPTRMSWSAPMRSTRPPARRR